MTQRLSKEVSAARRRTDEATMSATERAQLQRTIETQVRRRPMPWPLLAAAASGGVAALAVVLVAMPQELVEVERGSQCVLLTDDTVSASCSAAIRITNDSIELAPNTELVVQKRRLRMRRGRARFTVARRKARQPRFELRVSHGTITVLGTQFVVEQTELSGSLEVTKGRVGFSWDSGEGQVLSAGESIRWPPESTPDVSESIVEPDTSNVAKRETAPVKARAPGRAEPTGSDELVRRLLLLRSQGYYQEAASMLRSASRDGRLSRRDRERFSYELGLLYESQLPNLARECRHWRTHTKSFPRGRFVREVRRQVRDCAAK